MDVIVRHFGKIEDGELGLYRLDVYLANLKALDGKEIELTIQEHFQDTSYDQHKFYRGPVTDTILANEAFGGWEKDELHAFLTERFLGEDIEKVINGVPIKVRVVPSTANIGKKRMFNFTQKVIQWVATLGIEIQDPENYKY